MSTPTSEHSFGDTPQEKVSDNLPVAAEPKEDLAVVANTDYEYPTGVRLTLILVALLCTNLLVALDQTIVSTALPTIANHFQALSDVGWYGSAYLLTGTALQPLFGKLYSYFSLKYLFVFCLATFEVGSIICAAAPSSKAFIVGRAVAGIGFGGLYIGVLAIVAVSLPLERQAMFTSLVSASYGIGATVGPIIGGVFTSRVSWRWCFWINLPIGGLTIAIVLFFLDIPKKAQTLSVKDRLKRADWAGSAILLGSIICLLLSLQDGGIRYAWHSSRIIGLLVGFILLFICFIIVQFLLKEDASINIRVLKQRSVAFAALSNVAAGTTYFSLLYFIPIYFQAVRGSSAIHSSVQTLPFIATGIAGVIVAGGLVTSFGSMNIELSIGMALGAIGSGLLSMWKSNTGVGKWVGYQLLTGSGIGAAYMMPYMASQIIPKPEDKNAAATITIFAQTLGATIFVSASQAIYAQIRTSYSREIEKIPGLDLAQVIDSGVTTFRQVVGPEFLQPVIEVAVNVTRFLTLASSSPPSSLPPPPSSQLLSSSHRQLNSVLSTYETSANSFASPIEVAFFGPSSNGGGGSTRTSDEDEELIRRLQDELDVERRVGERSGGGGGGGGDGKLGEFEKRLEGLKEFRMMDGSGGGSASAKSGSGPPPIDAGVGEGLEELRARVKKSEKRRKKGKGGEEGDSDSNSEEDDDTESEEDADSEEDEDDDDR